MHTISTMLHAEALERDLERYRDTVGYVDSARIKERMVDTVTNLLGDQADSVDLVETIMLLPDGMSYDNQVAEIVKIISPVIMDGEPL